MMFLQELKENILKTIEEQMSVKEFEYWLYRHEALSNYMDIDIVLEAFSFNYKQKGARHAFKSAFLEYFDKEEFLRWKVKLNLQDLIAGNPNRDRILNEFYWMGYEEVPCLQNLGYYMYELEDSEYLQIGKESVIQNLKKDAQELFEEIQREELENSGFKISTFKKTSRLEFSVAVTNTSKEKEWWEFWK